MAISIIIPAHNEETGIAETIAQITDALRGWTGDWEIVVVDDGSTDHTAAVAETAGARVIRHLQNLGYGKALKDGILAAKHDAVVILDADGTYPVEQIPALVARFNEGYHMVVGERTGPHFKESLLKSPLRWILKALVEFTTGRRIPDVNSGFRIFDRREAMQHFPRLCDTFSFTTSLTLAYLMNNRFVAYVPVGYHSRIGQSKVLLVRDSLRTLQYIVQAILYYNPIKIFLVLAGLAVAFSIFCFSLTLAFGLVSTFLLGIGGLLSALIIFALGLVADLLRQIMNK